MRRESRYPTLLAAAVTAGAVMWASLQVRRVADEIEMARCQAAVAAAALILIEYERTIRPYAHH